MASRALKRGAETVLEGILKRRWGFPPRLMAPIVHELGPLRALCWMGWHLPRYERTLRVFGSVRTHLLCAAISVVNGCPYCTYGHAYALELAYLREHRGLFPLSEQAFDRLRGLSPAVIRHRLVEATRRAGLHNDVRWLDRAITLTLAERPSPTDEDDVRIVHLVRMFRTLNSVGIASAVVPDQAHSPLNKDSGLKMRYAGLRTAAGTCSE